MTMTPTEMTAPEQPKMSIAAAMSLVFGILGCIPFVGGGLAILCGIVGFVQTGPGKKRGRGLAIGGSILGFVSIIGWLLFGSAAAAWWWTRHASSSVETTAETFLVDVAKGDIASAKAMSYQFSDDDFTKLSAMMQRNGDFSGCSLTNTTIVNDESEAAGTATFRRGGANHDDPCTVDMKMDGGTWKVMGVTLPPPGGGGE